MHGEDEIDGSRDLKLVWFCDQCLITVYVYVNRSVTSSVVSISYNLFSWSYCIIQSPSEVFVYLCFKFLCVFPFRWRPSCLVAILSSLVLLWRCSLGFWTVHVMTPLCDVQWQNHFNAKYDKVERWPTVYFSLHETIARGFGWQQSQELDGNNL